MTTLDRYLQIPAATSQLADKIILPPSIPTTKTRSQLGLLAHYLHTAVPLLKKHIAAIRTPPAHNQDDVNEIRQYRAGVEKLLKAADTLRLATEQLLAVIGPRTTGRIYADAYLNFITTYRPQFELLGIPVQPDAPMKNAEQSIYLTNNDSLDQDMIERTLAPFNEDNTMPTEVSIDGHPVRTYSDGEAFFYVLFDGKTPIAYIRSREVRIVGGRPAYQSVSAAVISSKFGKGLVLLSYQGLLRDRILVSNDTQNAAGHNIFRRLWATGRYDFYLINNRYKLVSPVILPEGETHFEATVPGVRVYNSWSCLVVCSKMNRIDNAWLKSHLPEGVNIPETPEGKVPDESEPGQSGDGDTTEEPDSDDSGTDKKDGPDKSKKEK